MKKQKIRIIHHLFRPVSSEKIKLTDQFGIKKPIIPTFHKPHNTEHEPGWYQVQQH